MTAPSDGSPVELLVNGGVYHVRCDPKTPLLYVLRNDLGLLGAKFGCGLGLCGACNVIVEGHAVNSCTTPVWSLAGKNVTTIEGLGKDGEPHPVQEAFLAEQALQCGYCTAGMVMTAAALLDRSPDVDDQGIRTALDRNLCRCGAHNRILRAVACARDRRR